jgi:putative nucleotidyltransferase with HDIG domain
MEKPATVMKNNPERRNIPELTRKLFSASIKKEAILAWTGAFLICLFVILLNQSSIQNPGGNSGEFEAGKVADRDVISEKTFSYVDEKATTLRNETQERLVPAVFLYSYKETEEIQDGWNRFTALAASSSMNEYSLNAYRLRLQSEFSGILPDDVPDFLYQSRERLVILRDCSTILNVVLARGIYSMPPPFRLEYLNPDVVELIRQSGTRIEQEQVPLQDIATLSTSAETVAAYADSGSYLPAFSQIAPTLLKPFLKENIFYSQEATAQRIAETRLKIEPVMRSIEQGKRIIRKGFIVTEEDIEALKAFSMNHSGNDLSTVFGIVIFLLLVFSLLFYFCGIRVIGRNLTNSETYLVSALSALYIAGSVFVKNLSVEPMPASVVLPTALVMMLPSILIHSRLALTLAMALPLGAFLTGSFDMASYIFALVSGVVAAYSLQGAEKRMDLVKAGLIIAAANLSAMIAVLLWQRSPAGVYPSSLFWAAFNGVATGMLVLGVLSPLEHALNAATTFRLIELSDLNTPIFRRLFTAAPGTYSHSIMVASLAEAACLDIGANPFLARVGAYYHDLGKMDTPDYFVENQTDHNRHDDIAPRLSVTVIRSHVKLGIEKARQLGLPREVIDIIGEHHGNSVITWFYDKALKQENGNPKKSSINIEDYSYPGTPPRSRESAVVMLADMTEAAVRSLDKPTAVKIEKFIEELVAKKVEHGQLAQSELTFKDIEIIKNAFFRVLKAYYHNRIEYPKIDGEADGKDIPGAQEAAGK